MFKSVGYFCNTGIFTLAMGGRRKFESLNCNGSISSVVVAKRKHLKKVCR